MSRSSRLARLAPVVALIAAAGCCAPAPPQAGVPEQAPGEMDASVHAVLREATGATLYALHPYPHETEGPEFTDAERMHDYVVLGSAEVDAATAQSVLAEVCRGIADSDGTVAACFNPRHGVRVEGESGTVEFIICFECLSLEAYLDGERVQSLTTTRAPERVLAPVWASAGLTLQR